MCSVPFSQRNTFLSPSFVIQTLKIFWPHGRKVGALLKIQNLNSNQFQNLLCFFNSTSSTHTQNQIAKKQKPKPKTAS
jgi:hypothetical protein